MKSIIRLLRRLFASEDGPTAIEYAVMLALIIVVSFSSIQMMGCQTARAFYRAASALQD